MATVSHVIKSGLVHGKWYKVYVTQVSEAGLESPKSNYALIRVGDVSAPPVPVLAIDSAFGVSGYLKNNGQVDVGLAWNTPDCDDLDYFLLYVWDSFDWYSADGIYNKDSISSTASQSQWVASGAVSYTLPSQKNQKRICIGLQAIDISNNASDIYVISVIPEDTSTTEQPDEAMTVTPGVWSINVSITCPNSNELASVIFFRDNSVQLPPVIFHSGLTATIIDQLSPETRLTHYYTYLYVDKNGNKTPRSKPSISVTAVSIDTTLLDKTSLEALLDAWNSTNVENIKLLQADILTQSKTIADQASQLKTVTDNYNVLYDQYTVLANNISMVAASVETLDDATTSLQTAYTQIAEQITLRAMKSETDAALSQVYNAAVAAITVQADRITNIVSNLNSQTGVLSYAGLTMLNDAIQLKVSKNGVVSAINMSPETIQIASKFLHITGDVLADGSITVGKLNLASVFPTTISENGWIKLPGGLIIQWGVVRGISEYYDGNYSFNFPTRFPNATLNVSATTCNQRAEPTLDFVIQISAYNLSSCTLFINKVNDKYPNTYSDPVTWIAFGC